MERLMHVKPSTAMTPEPDDERLRGVRQAKTQGKVTGDSALGLGYSYSSENLLTMVNGGAWTGTLIR